MQRGPDHARRLLEQYGGRVVIHLRPPQGIADAFNFGVATAPGRWVWFLNARWGRPRTHARFLLALLEKSRSDVIVGTITYDGEAEPRHICRAIAWPPFRSWIPHPSTLIRRSLFDNSARLMGAIPLRWTTNGFWRCSPLPYRWMFFPSLRSIAPGGISQRPDSLSLIVQERDDAIRRYQGRFWRMHFFSWYRWLRAWLPAVVFPADEKLPASIVIGAWPNGDGGAKWATRPAVESC